MGAVLGSVRLEAVLGAGGMGRVYEGRDLSLARRVAVKVLDRGAPPEVRERFAREGRALGSLEHPNLVTVHSAGVAADGTPFITMKLLEARTLSQWAAGAPVSIDLLLPLLRQLSGAIDALHRVGILHRDLKPSNVMVDDAGHVTLVDLGVALSQGPRLTQVGLVVGTVDYMSPEQLAGEPLGPATDLYALGLLTANLLVGPRERSLREREQELAARFAGAAPRIDTLNPAIPGDVARVVERALAPLAKDRFQTAQAFVEALEAVVLAPRPREPGRPPAPRRRPWALLGAVVGLVLVVTLALLVVRWRAPRAVPAVDSDVVARLDLGGLRALSASLRNLPPTGDAVAARQSLAAGLVVAIAEASVSNELTRLHTRLLEQRGRLGPLPEPERLELARLVNRHSELLEREATARRELAVVAAALRATPGEAPGPIVDLLEGHAAEADPSWRTAIASLSTRSALAAQELTAAFDALEPRVSEGGLDTAVVISLELGLRGLEGARLEALLARAPATSAASQWLAWLRVIRADQERLARLVDPELDDRTIRAWRSRVREGQSVESILGRIRGDLVVDSDKREIFERKFVRVSAQCDAAKTRATLEQCERDVRQLHLQFYRE